MAKSEIFRSKVEKHPENAMFRFSFGQALFEEGELSEAIPHLTFCAESRDDWMLPRILLGKALLANGNSESAQTHLEAALALALEQNHEEPAKDLKLILSDL